MITPRIPVTYTPCTGVTEGSLGNDVPAFGTPVQMKAYSYQPHRKETLDGHTSRDVAEVDLAIPPLSVNLMSKFTISSDTYQVVGVRDNGGGHHGWNPGVVVGLKKVTG